MDSTHRQIILDEAKDDVGTNKNSCTSYASAAVHSDGPFMVHRPQVADEANQLLGGVRHAVVRPVCELQVSNKMCFGSLEWQFIKKFAQNLYLFIFYSKSEKKVPLSHLTLHHTDDLDVEVFQVLLVLEVKLVPAYIQRHTQLLWPVFVTFNPSPLYFLGHHGNDIGFIFPDHLPEGLHSRR